MRYENYIHANLTAAREYTGLRTKTVVRHDFTDFPRLFNIG